MSEQFSDSSAEFNKSPAAAIRRLEADCRWSSGTYADVVVNVSKYIEEELSVPSANQFMHELLIEGAMPDETLFEISPREALEQVRLLPAMKISDYQARFMNQSDYQEWFASAVSLAMPDNADYHRHSECLITTKHRNQSCANSNHCPMRSVRSHVLSRIYSPPTTNLSVAESASLALPEGHVYVELNTISQYGLIPPAMVTSLIHRYQKLYPTA